jgi:hypothetical protein
VRERALGMKEEGKKRWRQGEEEGRGGMEEG